MTIYKSLDEWQKGTKFNFNNFEAVSAETAIGGRSMPTQPIVSLSKNGLSLNSYLTVKKHFAQDYVQPFLAIGDGQLMLMFSNEDSTGKYKLQSITNGKTKHATVGMLLRKLNDDTDYINTSLFRYQFKPTLVDERSHRLILDLKNPYSKTKVRK